MVVSVSDLVSVSVSHFKPRFDFFFFFFFLRKNLVNQSSEFVSVFVSHTIVKAGYSRFSATIEPHVHYNLRSGTSIFNQGLNQLSIL